MNYSEKALLFLVLADIAVSVFPGSAGLRAVLTIAIVILGPFVLVRFAIRNLNRTMWRLRNRLIVSYLFIAVVPLLLVTALIAIAGYVLVGQVAIYAVSLELERRVAELPDPTAPSPEFLSNLAPSIGDVFIVERNKDS